MRIWTSGAPSSRQSDSSRSERGFSRRPGLSWGATGRGGKRRTTGGNDAPWQKGLLRLQLDILGDFAPTLDLRLDPHPQQVGRHCVARAESELRQALDEFAVLYDLV